MTSFVEVTRNGHVLEVKLNKPKVNAIDQAMSRELGAAFALLRDDPELARRHPDRGGQTGSSRPAGT